MQIGWLNSMLQESACLCLSSLGLQVCALTSGFLCGDGELYSGCHAYMQMLYQLRHHPSLWMSIYLKKKILNLIVLIQICRIYK